MARPLVRLPLWLPSPDPTPPLAPLPPLLATASHVSLILISKFIY
jgi:hypothetical protein